VRRFVFMSDQFPDAGHRGEFAHDQYVQPFVPVKQKGDGKALLVAALVLLLAVVLAAIGLYMGLEVSA
jgi:hypothetical protein